jgi:hypothetical protein
MSVTLGILTMVMVISLLAGITLIVVIATNKDDPTPPPKVKCSNYIPKEELYQITSQTPRCVREGVVTDQYYIEELDYVVSSVPTMPQTTVCTFFCKTFQNGVCTGDMYRGKTAQQNYDECMEKLTPKECLPPVPFAVRGIELFYPVAPTNSYCQY